MNDGDPILLPFRARTRPAKSLAEQNAALLEGLAKLASDVHGPRVSAAVMKAKRLAKDMRRAAS